MEQSTKIEPLPFKQEGTQFTVIEDRDGIWRNCEARFLESIRLYKNPGVPRGYAWHSGDGIVLTCYMRLRIHGDGGFGHDHHAFIDPRQLPKEFNDPLLERKFVVTEEKLQ